MCCVLHSCLKCFECHKAYSLWSSDETNTSWIRFLESLLSNLITLSPVSLPELHPYSATSQHTHVEHPERKNEKRKLQDDPSQRKGNLKKSKNSTVDEKLRQPTILDAFKKAGVVTSQTQQHENASLSSLEGKTASGSMHETCSDDEFLSVKIPQLSPALEVQRFKFRPLLPQCLTILKFPKVSLVKPFDLAEYLYLLVF